MDAARYWLALISIVAVPPSLLFWVIVHPFTRFWRRLGPALAYPSSLLLVAAMMAAIYALREPLMRVEFGFSAPLTALGIVFSAASAAIGLAVRRDFGLRTLIGLPQLSTGTKSRLVTDGIYAHVRHPRYVQVGFGLAGIASFSNYLAGYLTLAVWLPLVYVVVLLEERELGERFGEEYERYARRVPRFVPNLLRRH